MATRTIKPIHVVLPDAEGGYYRFGELPRLIADALYPEHPDDDEETQELQWMKHAFDGVGNYKKDLAHAAGLTDGESAYLHVVENTASKRPLELRMGAVLNAGLVHLDWLNEWGESRKPPVVFSMAGAPEPQAAPERAEGAQTNGKVWTAEKLAEMKTYREQHNTKKTAEHYGISDARVRQLLPSEKPQPKGYSAFTQRPK